MSIYYKIILTYTLLLAMLAYDSYKKDPCAFFNGAIAFYGGVLKDCK
jgi:hypothetical protein